MGYASSSGFYEASSGCSPRAETPSFFCRLRAGQRPLTELYFLYKPTPLSPGFLEAWFPFWLHMLARARLSDGQHLSQFVEYSHQPPNSTRQEDAGFGPLVFPFFSPPPNSTAQPSLGTSLTAVGCPFRLRSSNRSTPSPIPTGPMSALSGLLGPHISLYMVPSPWVYIFHPPFFCC